MTRFEGGCHCGAVRFEVEADTPLALLDCNCSMCAKTGYLHLIAERGQFMQTAGQDALAEYRFGTRAARHLFCKTCSIKSFYVPRSHPGGVSVNARCLDAWPDLETRIEPFDGQNWDAARRKLG